MKFTVRPDYVVHLETVVEVPVNGVLQKQVQANSFFGGQPCDLTEAQARDHAFKLHPADDESTAFLDSLVVKSPNAAPHAGSQEFNDAVAAAVAKALAEMGVKTKAA